MTLLTNKTTELMARDTCDKCNGVGVIESEIWKQFHEFESQFRKDNDESMTQVQVDKWFWDYGYYKLPPEEHNCDECDGTGKIQYWMTIAELKAILL